MNVISHFGNGLREPHPVFPSCSSNYITLLLTNGLGKFFGFITCLLTGDKYKIVKIKLKNEKKQHRCMKSKRGIR